MSARMIENHWLTDDYRNVMRLHFHSRVEFIGTLMEGILAISADGKIVGTLGVIGPTRMAYERVIPIVDITAKLVSSALSHG